MQVFTRELDICTSFVSEPQTIYPSKTDNPTKFWEKQVMSVIIHFMYSHKYLK